MLGLLLNPWLFWQYLHNMIGSVVTASFVMASVGAFYLLTRRNEEFGRTFVRLGVIAGMISTFLMPFPTGDGQGKNIALHQPPTLAAMEGLFETEHGAPLAIIGQPDLENRRLDNPLIIPRALSFLTYQRWGAEVKGLNDFRRDACPTIFRCSITAITSWSGWEPFFIGVMALASLSLWRGRLYHARPPALAADADAAVSLHRNNRRLDHRGSGAPAVADLRHHAHAEGVSPHVSAGNALFTLIGFMGIYIILGILFLFLVVAKSKRARSIC